MRQANGGLLTVAWVAILSVTLAGCAGTGPVRGLNFKLLNADTQDMLLWPEPPDTPRYEYLGDILGEQNFVDANGMRPEQRGGFWAWLTGIREAPPRPEVLERPQSGVVDPEGRIYVTDASRGAVFVFDPARGLLDVLEYAAEGVRFRSPVGIALDRAGNLLVADAELGAVYRLSGQGEHLGEIGAGVLRRPTGIAVDREADEIFVTDTEGGDVKVFDGLGRFVDAIGHHGDTTVEFRGVLNRPTHLAVFGGRLYVSDSLNGRVQVFDREGSHVMQIAERGLYVGNLTRPKGVAVDENGNVYVIEGFYDHLLIYDQEGRFLLAIGGTGEQPGQFYLPTGVWIDRGSRIYVADMFNARISVFQFLGAEQ